MHNLLDCINISTELDGEMIHKGLNFSIKNGEIVSLMGKSGVGKTSFANVLLGFITIKCGSILWKGKQMSLDVIKSRIGFQPQNGALLSDKTVLENVAMPLRYVANFDWNLSCELAMNKILLVGLSDRDFCKYPHMLSGGMIKRVALARAMSMDPELLILDEPMSGLDAMNSRQFENLIWRISHSTSVICITHNFIKSHKYYILEDGKVLQLSEELIKESEYVKF